MPEEVGWPGRPGRAAEKPGPALLAAGWPLLFGSSESWKLPIAGALKE